MDKGKYYVSKATGEVWYVMESGVNVRTGSIFVHLWNCATKENKGVYGVPQEYEEYFLEVTKEQAFNTDFQKWMKLCYGKQ